MNLNEIKTKIAEDRFLQSLAGMKVSASVLNSETARSVLSGLTDETSSLMVSTETIISDIDRIQNDLSELENKTISISGQTDIGPLALSGDLSVNNQVKISKSLYIGNAPDTIVATSANMMFALGQNLSVFGTNSMAIGSNCAAGTNVLSVVNMRLVDDETLPENTIQLDSVDGLSAGQTYLLKITTNYGVCGQITAVDPNTNTIVCDQIPKISKSSFMQEGKPKTPVTGANKTTYLNILWIKDHPEIGTIAYADGAHAEGISTKATQDCCHAEGYKTVALGKYSHAEGYATYAGYNGHSEGYQTSAMIIVRTPDEYDLKYNCSTLKTQDSGSQGMHAEGSQTRADQYNTHADGQYAWACHSNSYVWNGGVGGVNNMYRAHGVGTYNISPKDNLSGFYIGEKNMFEHIQDETRGLADSIKNIESSLSDISIGSTLTANLDNNIKTQILIGYNLSTDVEKSIVIGRETKTGTALDPNERAKGWECIAIGNFTRACGKNAIAIGNGDDSFAETYGDWTGNRGVSGDYSIAIGNAGVEGRGGIAIGQQNHARQHGISLGRMNQGGKRELSADTCVRTGRGAITIGTYSVASADNSIVIGNGYKAGFGGQVIIGAPTSTSFNVNDYAEPGGQANKETDENHMTWLGSTSDPSKIWFGNKSLSGMIGALAGKQLLSSDTSNDYIMEKLVEIYTAFGGTVQ